MHKQKLCACMEELYRQKFLRHENFVKSLKTGFSYFFVQIMTPDICKS